MIQPHAYDAGYLASLLGWPALCNPWPLWCARERAEWAMGHSDGRTDSSPRAKSRLEAEFEQQ